MLFFNFHVQGNFTYKSIFAVFLELYSLDSDNQVGVISCYQDLCHATELTCFVTPE